MWYTLPHLLIEWLPIILIHARYYPKLAEPIMDNRDSCANYKDKCINSSQSCIDIPMSCFCKAKQIKI